MIAYFKNSAFRIWGAGILAFAASLWLLSYTSGAISLTAHLLLFGALFVTAYAGIGWLANHIVRIQFNTLLQEAGILERDAMIVEAEQTYTRTLTLLDSFLVSPRRRRHYLRVLGARMARFYAAQAEKSDRALQWITRYLNTYPGDSAVAEAWLQEMEGFSNWHKSQQDLATRIGDALSDDWRIQRILARFYIRSDRTDFTALQTYRRIMADKDHDRQPTALDLANLFLKEGRADELALRAYVDAAHRRKPSNRLLCGLAAGLRWNQANGETQDLIARARQIIGPIADNDLERMASGFLPPSGHLAQATDMPPPGARHRSRGDGAPRWFTGLGHHLRQHIHQATRGFTSPRLRSLSKAGLISVLALAAVALLWNTAGHLAKPPSPPPAPPPEVAVKIAPAPYTLQVAAYLKPDHAERFMAILRDKGQNAYRVEARSRQKTWYQVRLGHFPTKAAARTYGLRLKSEGIIEDFYVANYKNP